MKKAISTLTVALSCLILIFTIAAPAYANADKVGSLNVVAINKADNNPLVNKTISIIKVADYSVSSGNESFTLTSDFSEADGIDLYDTKAPKTLYDIAVSKGIPATGKKTNSEGIAVFNDCVEGAYIVYSPDNYFNPFIVLIPEEGNNYDVTAEPKINLSSEETTKKETETDKTETRPSESVTSPSKSETVTDKTKNDTQSTTSSGKTTNPINIVTRTNTTNSSGGGSNSGSGGVTQATGGTPISLIPVVTNSRERVTTSAREKTTKDNDREETTERTPEKLPQTGMLQYPIPILGFCGVLMFAIGLVIYGEGKKKEN